MAIQTTGPIPEETTGSSSDFGSEIMNFVDSLYFSKFFIAIQIIIGLYCLILIFNITYCSLKLSLFKKRVRQFVTGTQNKPETYKSLELLPEKTRISEIYKKTVGGSQSDWKIAVIEADKTLDQLLKQKGFSGSSLGERLKEMVPADLPDIYEEVWEAHKIRNQIVHEPDFEVSQSEARQIVGIYDRAIKKLG